MDIKEVLKNRGYSLVDNLNLENNIFHSFAIHVKHDIKPVFYDYSSGELNICLNFRFLRKKLNIKISFFDINDSDVVSFLSVKKGEDKDELILLLPVYGNMSPSEDIINSYVFDSISFYLVYCTIYITDKNNILHFFSFSDYLDFDENFTEEEFNAIRDNCQYFKMILFFGYSEFICNYFSSLHKTGYKMALLDELSFVFEVSNDTIIRMMDDFNLNVWKKRLSRFLCF